MELERAVEGFVAITSLVMGASHLFRHHDWSEAYRRLHACGRPGAFLNGGISLFTGAAIVAPHPTWTWPASIITTFGYLLLAKGTISLLAPDKALKSMERGNSPTAFVVAGCLLMAVGIWACYCLLSGLPNV